MNKIDRRRFIEGSTLLALVPYVGRAFAQDVPRSSFPADVTAEQVTAGIDMSGKTVVVTGCNSGIGLETMRVLALRGAHVIGTARTIERGREACASVQGRATPVVLELSDFDSVVACAKAIRELTQRCTDVLEMYVRRYPHLWLWMHRRWRDGDSAETGSVAVFPAPAPGESD